MGSITVDDLVPKFLEYAAATVAPSTLYGYRHQLEGFLRHFTGRITATLNAAELRTWGRTFHRIQAVQRMTSWGAGEARLLDRDPLAGMRRPATGRRLRTLTLQESARMRRRAQGACRMLVIALGETIARPHELRAVTWQNVFTAGLQPAGDDDLVAGRAFFFLDRFKAQSRRRDQHAVRVIPISPRLGRMLARLRRAGPAPVACVFLNQRRAPWTVNAVRCSFRRLRARAGIVKDYRGENVVAYTLRHSAATAAIVAGVELGALSGAMGHSDVRMTMRYVHLSPSFLAQVLDRVNAAKTALRSKNGSPGLRRTRPDDAR